MINNHIIIPSFLGNTPELQKIRLETHLEQRKVLKKLFPKLKILSLCSGYSTEAKKAISQFETLFLPKPTLKYIKHRKIFNAFSKVNSIKSVLLLDDDTIPDEENEFGLDPIQILTDWLLKPKTMPADFIFFSGRDLLHDTYTNARPPTISTAPMHVAGQMVLYRNSIPFLILDSEFRHYQTKEHVAVDTVSRMKAASIGIPTAKHRGVFFKTLCSLSSGKTSTIAESQTIRKHHRIVTNEHIYHLWPWLFVGWCGKENKRRPVPIWEQRGQKLTDMIRSNILIQNEHGVITPNPKKLKSLYEKKHQIHPSLEVLLNGND